MSNDWYRNERVSKDQARVFKPANRCIYCDEGKPPFTREHVIPRGLGGGFIYPKASCESCRKIIHEIETYCMRGPFLSHRLNCGLVNDLNDLGNEIEMRVDVGDRREQRTFTPEELPHYLILPQFHDPPGATVGRSDGTGRVSYTIWGDEQMLLLHGDGDRNAVLAEGFDLNKFGRAIAKIAHGYVAGEYGLENFSPFLPPYILNQEPNMGDMVIGNWGEDGMARHDHLLHQIGVGFMKDRNWTRIDVRLRLFASHDQTPVYRIVVGVLTKPINDVLAPLGQRAIDPSG